MKKSPHRFFLFMCSCCSCSFSPCRRLHMLKAGSKWIELVCGRVAIRLASQRPHLKLFSRCSRAGYRLLCAWLHSQRTSQHKGHQLQNGRTLPIAFAPLHHSKDNFCLLPIMYLSPSAIALSTLNPLLFSFPLVYSPYPSLSNPLMSKLLKCNLAFKGKTANTLQINIIGYFWYN